MNESQVQKMYKYLIYPRRSKTYSDEGFVNIDGERRGGTHWTCFYVKDSRSYYFDNFGAQKDKFLPNQIPKPITYHKYKIQDINSKLGGSYCLSFFYLIERMNFYDTLLKVCFYKLEKCQLMYLVTVTQIILVTKLILLYLYKNHSWELNI